MNKNTGNPTLTSTFDTPGSAYKVTLSSDGKTAFVADGNSGVTIINIRDLSNPILIKQFDSIGGTSFDVTLSTDGNTAFVANSGLKIINISDLSNPSQISAVATSGVANAVTLSPDGRTAFLATGTNGLVIIDISDLSNPSQISRFDTPGTATDVTVSADGKTAFVSDARPNNNLKSQLSIIDISDLYNPSQKSIFDISGLYAHTVTLSSDGNTAFVGSGNLNAIPGLSIINISDLSNPTLINQFGTNNALDLSLSADGNTIFVADNTRGITIIDISDLSNPSEISRFDTVGQAYGITLSPSGTSVFVADFNNGLVIIDINSAPTDINLSTKSITENSPIGTAIGTLTTTDNDISDTFTYTLVSGAGDTNNNDFTINGNQLVSNKIFDYELKNTYFVRIQTSDTNGGTFQKQFIINVIDVNKKSSPWYVFVAYGLWFCFIIYKTRNNKNKK